jgi:AAA15 family ATPase/GTPase
LNEIPIIHPKAFKVSNKRSYKDVPIKDVPLAGQPGYPLLWQELGNFAIISGYNHYSDN